MAQGVSHVKAKARKPPSEAVWGRQQVMGLTLTGVLALGLVFGLGFLVGQRMAKLDPGLDQGSDTLTRLDAERQMYHDLTFYTQLTSSAPSSPHTVAPVMPLPGPMPSASRLDTTKKPTGQSVSAKPAPKPSGASPSGSSEPLSSEPLPLAASEADVWAALRAGPAQAGDYTVQVGSFQTEQEAQALVKKLEPYHWNPFMVTAQIPQKGTWYRVRVGRFTDEAQAKRGEALLASHHIQGWVLKSE